MNDLASFAPQAAVDLQEIVVALECDSEESAVRKIRTIAGDYGVSDGYIRPWAVRQWHADLCDLVSDAAIELGWIETAESASEFMEAVIENIHPLSKMSRYDMDMLYVRWMFGRRHNELASKA